MIHNNNRRAMLQAVKSQLVVSLLLLIATELMAACERSRHFSSDQHSTAAVERQCVMPSQLQPALAVPFQTKDDGVAAESRWTPAAVDVARTIGVLDLLADLQTLHTEAANKNVPRVTFRLLRVRQELSDRIQLALLDVARTAAEADCEEERADQLADRLQEARDTRIRRFTITAIIIDALIAALAGSLTLAGYRPAAVASSIAGGLVAATFGTAALLSGGEHEFQHPRNLLREVWEGPTQAVLMPESVWRFLNRPVGDRVGPSLRQALIERWQEDGRLGQPGSASERRRVTLIFGEAGTYQIDDLRSRAAMLDLLEADINLMSQDLALLMQEVLIDKDH